MKRILLSNKNCINLLLGLIVLLFVACTSNEKQRLQQIENVLEESPDTAWAMLSQDGNRLSKYSKSDRMKYLLLRTKAMNKLFYAMDTINYMNDVLEYYAFYGNTGEKTWANYLMGCVYRDKGNSPKALLYYNEAVAKIDTTKSDCNFSLLSKVYGQMADIYRLQRYPQLESKILDKKALVALMANDTLGYVRAQERKISVFYQLGKMDSVYQIATLAYRYYKKIGKDDYAAATLIPLTEIYLKRKDYVKAKRTLDEYLAKSKLLDKKGEPLYPGTEYFYNYLGWYYIDVGQLDSALYCYRKLLNYPSDIENLEAGYKGLMSIYSHKGMVDSVVKYVRLYADANDTVNFRLSAKEVGKVQALFDYSESQKEAARKAEEAKNIWKALFISLLMIVILLLVIRKMKARNQKRQTQYDHTKKELVSTKKESKLKDSKIVNLNGILSIYKTNANEEKWKKENIFMESKIILAFQAYANTGKQPTVSEWKDLQKLVEASLPAFWQKLSSFEDILDDEFRICLLTRLSFMPSQIANLLGASKQSITNKRKKLVQMLFKSDNIKKFDALIKEME